jgi:hypothetical protein
VNRSERIVFRTFGIWTIYVWVTRIWNIWRDKTRGAGFKAVHTVIAVISVGLAIACLALVRRIRLRSAG